MFLPRLLKLAPSHWKIQDPPLKFNNLSDIFGIEVLVREARHMCIAIIFIQTIMSVSCWGKLNRLVSSISYYCNQRYAEVTTIVSPLSKFILYSV